MQVGGDEHRPSVPGGRLDRAERPRPRFSFGLAWLQRAEALAGMGRVDEAIDIMEQRVANVGGFGLGNRGVYRCDAGTRRTEGSAG